jgi:hypothetical protein
MQRPKRACTERAQQKIQEILQWEACSESSQGADSGADTDKEADDSHEDADKKAEAFQSQAPETQEEPCSLSQN